MTLTPKGRAALHALEERRTAAGLCRHCGGAVPCWSEFGDHAPGQRHTRRTLKAARAELVRSGAARLVNVKIEKATNRGLIQVLAPEARR